LAKNTVTYFMDGPLGHTLGRYIKEVILAEYPYSVIMTYIKIHHKIQAAIPKIRIKHRFIYN